MVEPQPKPSADTVSGAAVYGPIFIRFFYDIFVLVFSFTYVWRCPIQKLSAFFTSNIARAVTSGDKENEHQPFRLLDMGVGTGYHLQHSPMPEKAHVDLVDLRDVTLGAASRRLKKAHPTVTMRAVLGDFLEEDKGSRMAITSARFPDRFDAISCMLLLHCVPGPPSRKADGLRRLAPLLKPDGVVFGATILGNGVKHSLLARLFMARYNKTKKFSNVEDDAEGLLGPLRGTFADIKTEIVGGVLLFELREPR
jgi:2-polyprenyl-3-methyl-5-hydroxy-6-metoxy-1,4-benzoquinol methylase